MIIGNSYILIFSVLVFLIILLVSTTPIIIKTLLVIITIGFLFPIIRKILFKDKFRKIKVAFYSSLSFTIGFFLISFLISMIEEQSFNLNGELFGFTIILLFYSLIGNFVYG
ncbi:putative membrane channel-forming protein YqfA (hemolysin III family) [Peribacillus simplex]|nr:putative membrane channel-forming protein YqfA (hemolysin III family) [Peribacillus simplex]